MSEEGTAPTEGTLMTPAPGQEAAPAAPAAPADWRAGIPEDIRSDPSLADIKTVEALAKSYVHAQKMVGVDKLPAPKDDWTDEQRADFWGKLGRPDGVDGYIVPEVDGLQIDKDALKPAMEVFHNSGLTQKQAEDIMGFYLNDQAKAMADATQKAQAGREAAEQALRDTWGDGFDKNLAIAQSSMKQFGSEELVSKLEQSGLGNDPDFIKLMAKMGEAFVEDNGRSDGVTLQLPGAARAQQELGALKMDGEFMARLTDRNKTGHKEALEKWQQLHKVAATPVK